MILQVFLSLFLGLSTPAWAEDVVDNVLLNDRNAQETLNDQLRRTSRRLRELEGGVSLTSGVTGILPVANGGTGKDWSATAAWSIPTFSATGVMGTVGIGTSGYFLQSQGTGSTPIWAANTQNVDLYNTTAPLQALYENDTNTGVASGSTVAYRTAPFSRSGTVKVAFRAKALNGAATGTAYIRKNGVQVGTNVSLGAGYGVDTEEFSVTKGDYFDVYFSVCTNNCQAIGFWVYAGNPSDEAPTSADGTTAPRSVWKFGTGSPTTNTVSCNVGDIYSRKDGGAGSSFYVCEAVDTWAAK